MKQKAAGGLLTWINCSLNRLNNSKRKKKLKKKSVHGQNNIACVQATLTLKKKIGEMIESVLFFLKSWCFFTLLISTCRSYRYIIIYLVIY